ncbi:hypothetical protein HN960_05400 [Candidatus Peregrinibacteria bacterium]|jgi:putative FmdB family regulatory protein|nr:hypothetical protein [Candidatus Peregrinibacteria bacterium]MBT7009838.1 hypothetical protein [Candidatus Peregrinibacteria bacterium]
MLYTYKCTSCKHQFTYNKKISDETKPLCPVCDLKTERVFTSVPVIYKANGFYSKDNQK